MKVRKIFLNEKYVVDEKGNVINENTGHILNSRKKKSGYYYVKLTLKHRKSKEYLHHRITAMAWHKPYNLRKVVNHKNKNKKDNSPKNVQWLTVKQNIKHRDNK